MCNIRRFYLLRELYAADFHKPGIYGNAGEYGPTRGMCFDARRLEVVAVLTRGTCFVARRLEVVAVAGLLWISWGVLGAARFFCFCFFPIYISSSNGHGLMQVCGPLALFTSLLVPMCVQGAII